MLIGICGKKFSGKSTVARLLHNATGYEVVSFADKLKDVTCVLAGCTREDLEDYDFKENELVPDYLRPYCGNAQKPTYRAFLQHFGSEVMRGVNDNIWIDCTLGNCGSDVIVSDVRFPNEARAIRSRGGVVIKVVRDTQVVDSHCSESSIDDIVPDYTLFNDTNLENLVANVDTLVRVLRVNGKI